MSYKISWLRWLIRIAGLFGLAYVLATADFAKLWFAIKNVNYFYLSIALMAAFGVNGFKGLRLYYMLGCLNLHYSAVDCVKTTFIANYLGAVTPGRIGELIQAGYLKDDAAIPFSVSLPVLIYLRLFDFYIVGMIVVIGLATWEIDLLNRGLSLFLFPALALSAGLIFIPKIFLRILQFVGKKSGQWDGIGEDTGNIILLCLKQIGFLLLLTVLLYVFLFGRCLCLSEGMDLPLSLPKLIFIISLVNIVSYLPISIAGLGTTQVALVFLFVREGITKEDALIFSFLLFGVVYLWGILLGALVWLNKSIKIRRSLPEEAR